MCPTTHVLLADPDSVSRHALALLLRSKFNLDQIAEAAEGTALARGLAADPPDLLLLDWALPGRPPAADLLALRQANPGLKLVILSVDAADASAARALNAVFIHKASPAAQVVAALRQAMAQETESDAVDPRAEE